MVTSTNDFSAETFKFMCERVKLADEVKSKSHLIFSMHSTAIFLTSWSANV